MTFKREDDKNYMSCYWIIQIDDIFMLFNVKEYYEIHIMHWSLF